MHHNNNKTEIKQTNNTKSNDIKQYTIIYSTTIHNNKLTNLTQHMHTTNISSTTPTLTHAIYIQYNTTKPTNTMQHNKHNHIIQNKHFLYKHLFFYDTHQITHTNTHYIYTNNNKTHTSNNKHDNANNKQTATITQFRKTKQATFKTQSDITHIETHQTSQW